MTAVRSVLTVLAVMALGVATAAPLGLRSLDEPIAAAPLSLPNLDGESVDLASLRGKAVVVNFWASWCAPCVHELPALGRVAEALADDGVRFLAVAMAQRTDEILAFERDILDQPIPFPVLVDPDATVSEAWQVRSLPTSFLIGPDGRVHARVNGAWHWDSAAMRSRLRELAAAGEAVVGR